jgi:small subunit ribosomal protein S2
MLGQVTMKQLLEAGVHFGHQRRRWNPKMKKYIYTERNQIYIIDLKKTLRLMREAYTFVRDNVAEGGKGIFIGTKKQSRDAIEKYAHFCGMYYVNNRWLGGTLTNFDTIRKSINRMIELQTMVADGSIDRYSKKEQSRLLGHKESLERNLQGIRDMKELPSFIFVIDPSKETIAVHEAKKMGIPIVAVVDTNCDPDPIDWVIPGNDDAIRSINLSCEKMAEACIEGQIMRVEAGLASPDSLPEAGRQLLAQAMAEDMGGGEGAEGGEEYAAPERPARPPQPRVGTLAATVNEAIEAARQTAVETAPEAPAEPASESAGEGAADAGTPTE